MTTALLHLNLIPGIGPAVIRKLVAGFEDARGMYQADVGELVRRCGMASEVAEKVVTGLRDTKLLESELSLLAKHRIGLLTLADSSYPALLREIHMPPVVLYYQGSLPAANTMALVGSRDADEYGSQMVARLVPALVANDWVTVSGGALGADSMVHEQTLRAGGKTVAVLGSGLLCPYPTRNRSLFAAIVEQGGALVSSFPLTATPLPGNFPARNRIIAGLSRGCVVIQAAAKSGALITAYYALEQSRDVFACPGRATDDLSAGCNRLIKQGAKLVQEANDILEEYGQQVPSEVQTTLLSSLEDTIRAHCELPKSAEELALLANLALPDLYTKLLNLQLEGKIDQNAAGLFVAV